MDSIGCYFDVLLYIQMTNEVLRKPKNMRVSKTSDLIGAVKKELTGYAQVYIHNTYIILCGNFNLTSVL